MKKCFLIILTLFLKSTLAIGCTCPQSLSMQEIIKNAKYIFNCTILERKLVTYDICKSAGTEVSTSQVDSLRTTGCLVSYYRYKVSVNKNYKKEVKPCFVYIETPIGGSMCEIFFEINKRYIIYLEDEFTDQVYCYLTSCDKVVGNSSKERRILYKELNVK